MGCNAICKHGPLQSCSSAHLSCSLDNRFHCLSMSIINKIKLLITVYILINRVDPTLTGINPTFVNIKITFTPINFHSIIKTC